MQGTRDGADGCTLSFIALSYVVSSRMSSGLPAHTYIYPTLEHIPNLAGNQLNPSVQVRMTHRANVKALVYFSFSSVSLRVSTGSRIDFPASSLPAWPFPNVGYTRTHPFPVIRRDADSSLERELLRSRLRT